MYNDCGFATETYVACGLWKGHKYKYTHMQIRLNNLRLLFSCYHTDATDLCWVYLFLITEAVTTDTETICVSVTGKWKWHLYHLTELFTLVWEGPITESEFSVWRKMFSENLIWSFFSYLLCTYVGLFCNFYYFFFCQSFTY